MAWEERGSRLNIFRMKNHGRITENFMNYETKYLLRKCVDHVLTYSGRKITVVTFTNYQSKDFLRKNLHELRGKRLVAQVTETRRFALYLRTRVDLMFELDPSWIARSVDHSGFDVPIGVFISWEEIGSCFNIFRMTNHGQFQFESSRHWRSVDHVLTYSVRKIAVRSQKPSPITRQKTCCGSESNTSIRVAFANQSGFDVPIGVLMAWEEFGSCLNIFRTKNRGWIPETLTNYEAKDFLRNESNTSVRVVFVNRSGFDAPIALDMAWEERGSCINIFRMPNCGRISETFTNYEVKDLLRKQKTCCARESNTSVRIVFANRSGFDAPIGWEERGSCLNIFQTTNRGRISETFMNYEAKDLFRKNLDHVLTYFGRQIVVGSQKPSHIIRRKTCCASESNTLVRVVLANRSGFDAPIAVVIAWETDLRNLHELRGKRLVALVSQTRRFALYLRTVVVLMLQLESSWHGRSVDHVLTYFGREIAIGSQKPSRITRQKTCCASESNTSVRVVFVTRSGFDAPIGVVFAWEERGSCLNIFQTKNRCQILETFANYVAKGLLRKRVKHSSWHGRSVDHVLTYSGRQITIGYQKPSRITRQKTCCPCESNTSVHIVFANRSGFEAPIAIVLAWEERGSCLNIFRTTNRGRISETFMNYEAKDLLPK
ncbi:uncharacterized protein G2W53_041591 [Senna tora]|uniref:Uncharacterized protein n=1 Tax=Senna tora TaxID=362788 RepID=A0A834SE03_9FABA|nr:uncharacterized protein G2W53_041591 [Senna tora]